MGEMVKFPLTEHQKDLLRAIEPGLQDGTVDTEWSVDQSQNNIIDIYGIPDTLRLGLWADVKRTDFDKFIACGFLKLTDKGVHGRSMRYSLDEYRIIEAINNNFGDNIPPNPEVAHGFRNSDPLRANNASASKYEFDFVISYAGEDENFAEQLNEALQGAKVFFAPQFQGDLWGANLFEVLSKIYSKSGRFFIPIISQYYVSKQWTLLEWKSAQERAVANINEIYILPIRLDDTELPGLLSTTAYLDAQKTSVRGIAQIALQKLETDRLSRQTGGSVTLQQTVKYGDAIMLKHAATGYWLYSDEMRYSHDGTSGEQQIIASLRTSAKTNWLVKPAYEQLESYKANQSVQQGDIIRLEHQATGLNLHSHLNHPAPLTRQQQEVVAFGHHDIGDNNDNWRIEIENAENWYPNQHIRLIHVNTNCALHSHKERYASEALRDYQEVTCFVGRDNNDWWLSTL